MKIVIAEIPPEGVDVELKEHFKFDDSLFPAQANLKIQKVGTEVLIKGTVRAEVQLQCRRCLKDFESSVDASVDVVYHPVEELRDEEKHGLKVEELDMGFYSGGELDLSDLIKEQVVLNLPMKPLCSNLCKGICPYCGGDLNKGDCGCAMKEGDPRLAVLKKLKGK